MKSTQGRTIEVHAFGSVGDSVLIVAGVHGDETEGVTACNEVLRRLRSNVITPTKSVSVVTCLNPDGYAMKQRSNANDVDLNRNLPTSNWRVEPTNSRYKPGPFAASEVETQAFVKIVSDVKPKLIISLHSFTESLLLFLTNDFNRPFRSFVDSFAEAMAVPVVEKMNYEIFGSLSRWGLENGIGTLTVKLLKNQNDDTQIQTCADQISKFLVF